MLLGFSLISWKGSRGGLDDFLSFFSSVLLKVENKDSCS